VDVWRVRAVVPCFNRRRDVELLLDDLAALDIEDIELSVVLVDNASDQPLADIQTPPGLKLEHVRLSENTGGSGGYNAGIHAVLNHGTPGDASELIWLIDSDVRLRPDTLTPLVRALEQHQDCVVVGSALADPDTGRIYEAGGFVSRRHGDLHWPKPGPPGTPEQPVVAEVGYVAACSMMVRRSAVEKAGLMPDVFLNGDDVDWCVRLAKETGGKIGATTASVVTHPNPDRMRLWDRYYIARNTFVAIDDLGLGPIVRCRRAWREVARAACQVLMGRDDLARLHLLGLADAAAGRVTGRRDPEDLRCNQARPIDQLKEKLGQLAPGARSAVVGAHLGIGPDDTRAVCSQLSAAGLTIEGGKHAKRHPLFGAIKRWLIGPPAQVAVVAARGRPDAWFAGRVLITIAPGPDGPWFVARRISRLGRLAALARLIAKGTILSLRLALRAPVPVPATPPTPCDAPPTTTPTLSVVVLCYNRRDALAHTLDELDKADATHGAQIVVVDNGSSDESADMVRKQYPRVDLVPLEHNVGVAGFNRGVERATGEAVLILDDDSWPDDAALASALTLLGRRPAVAAVTFHRVHPRTGVHEWPFAGARADGSHDRWPDMGCGNLVRRDAWLAVGGYEETYFLYRNDTDLALKLLGAGLDVHYDPRWVVYHDSPVVQRKTNRWLHLSTRNWIWTARRHGRGWRGLSGLMLGWVWAHRLAGFRPGGHAAVLRGVAAGLAKKPPKLPDSVKPDGSAFARLIQLKLRYRGGA
jgi:GT2 family glycosyltransferase